jgi:hypothetical protein
MGLISKIARRNRWLARRLWLIMAVEVAWIANVHWRRLEPEERLRLRELAVKSKGRPGRNLSDRERREARDLLEKLDYAEFGGNVARALLPFRPVGKLVEQGLGHTKSKESKEG